MIRASVVIPVYQRADLLGPCLAALERAGLDGVELVLVDNASTDPAMPALLNRWEGRATVIRNAVNEGFAAACNVGAGHATGPALVFLNSDTEVRPGWLAPLIAALADPRVGVAGSRLLYPDGRIQHAGMALIAGSRPYHLHRGAPGEHPVVTRSRDLLMVTGACLAILSARFRAAGGFDEEYRNGFEDADLCLRLAGEGLVARYCADSVVVHHEGMSPGRDDREDTNADRFARRFGDRPPDFAERLREDGLSPAPPDILVIGPLFDGSPEAGRNLAEIEALATEGRRPMVREAACGPLAAGSVALCSAPVLLALNREGLLPPPAARRAAPGSTAVGWCGPVLGRSGYAAAGRGLLAAAAGSMRDVVVSPLDAVPAGMEPPALPSLGDQGATPGLWVLHHIPVGPDGTAFWERLAGHFGAPVIGATCFESDGLPPSWVAACSKVREVWVPGAFNAGTFAAAGVDPERLHVVPYPVDCDLFSPGPPVPPSDVFTFLSVFEWTWRKGWDALLAAYVTEFDPSEPVRLQLLTYRGAGALGGGDVWSQALGYLEALGRDPETVPDIDLLLDAVSTEGLVALYRGADAFVLPTRGEGAGMPVFEAMACGTPVIATDFGGHAELMTPDLAYPVAVERMVPAPPALVADNALYAGQRLAEPSVGALRRQMRAAYEDRTEAARRAGRARRAVVERLSVPSVARVLDARLEAATARRTTVGAA